MNAVNVGLEACPGVHADGRLQIQQEGLAAADMLCLLPQVQQLTVERLLVLSIVLRKFLQTS